MAAQPSGKVCEVFRTNAERQDAYDFLSNQAICAASLVLTVARATARRCGGGAARTRCRGRHEPAADDRLHIKEFGALGATNLGARGLNVVHAYAVREDGVPLGVLNQQWWARVASPKRNDCDERPLEGKETLHWVRAIEEATRELREVGATAWFQVDWEGDRFWTLKALHTSGQRFTVRSTYDHRFLVDSRGRHKFRLREVVAELSPRYERVCQVRRRWTRLARRARFEVRTTHVALDMVEAYSNEGLDLPVAVVDVREVGTTPRDEKPLHWQLLTNQPITTRADVERIIDGYAKRWSIEEHHRAWKSRVCRVEDAQLRTTHRMVKWAVISIAVAARVERLKALARAEPQLTAIAEITAFELSAARLLLGLPKDSNRPDQATLAKAVSWIAQVGGYTGDTSGGPPGSSTLRRGLEGIAPVAMVLARLHGEDAMR
ncbi:MAG: hypothetical protein RL385_2684 [Pseudomonadota bacterium]